MASEPEHNRPFIDYLSKEHLKYLVDAAPVGIIISDQNQDTLYVNQKFTEVYGYTRSDMPSLKDWWPLASSEREEGELFCQSWDQAYREAIEEGREVGPVEFTLRCKDGTERPAEFRLNSLGELNIVLISDVTERKKTEQDLKESEEKFRALAENSPVAILIYQDDYFVYTNPAGPHISGYSKEELYQMRFWELIHPDYRDLVRSRGKMRQSGKPAPSGYDFKIITKQGEEKWVNLTGSTTIFRGKPAGFISVIDITAHKEVVQALQFQLKFEKLVADISSILVNVSSVELEESIKQALKLCGEFIQAERSHIYQISDDGETVEQVFEWCAQDTVPRKVFLEGLSLSSRPWWTKELLNKGRVYIPDVENMPPGASREQELFQQHNVKSLLAIAVKKGSRLRRVLNFVTVQEHREWSEEQIALLRVVAEIISNAISRQRAEKALEESEKKYREILATMEEGYYEIDLAGNFTFFNDSMCKLVGYSPDQLMGKNYRILYNDSRRLFEPYNQVYRTGISDKAANIPIKTGDGRDIFAEVSITLRYDDQEKPIGFCGIVRDITERKIYEDKLKYLSLHDQLTGLYNRTYFDDEIGRLDNSRSHPITIIVCDLDGLKLINDTLGHDSGDHLLVACCNVLKQCLRASDILARVGGDEFVAILPQTDRKSGQAVVSRIMKQVDKYNEENSFLPISISTGIATLENSAFSLWETYKEADDLMYRDKLQKGAGAKSQIIKSLVAALGERDFSSEGHLKRLDALCRKVGEKIKLPPKQLSNLTLLARVHDLGQVGIPDQILFKEGPLNEEEWKIMRTHTEKGHRIASASTDLYGIADLILHHHERWDGTGYPSGLEGDSIPLECRILAIIDAYDAMISPRPYSRALKKEEAIEELRRNSGKQFDPYLVGVFLSVI